MPREFDNTNRGVLFENDRKREGKQDPDRSGSINVEGVDYFLDGWFHEKDGRKYLSLSVKRKDKQSGGGGRPADDDDGW